MPARVFTVLAGLAIVTGDTSLRCLVLARRTVGAGAAACLHVFTYKGAW